MELQWPLILFTFFLCVAGGTIGVQGLLTVLGKGKKTQLASLIVSGAALVIGGISVFTHLQHWERIFNGFGHITSGITLEMIGCVLFAIVWVLYLLMMRRADDGMAPKWCGILAIIIGIALPAVTGDSYLMPALPAWNTPMLIVYYIVNTLFMGGLILMLLSAIKGADDSKDTSTSVALAGGVLSLIVVIAYAAIIAGSGDAFTNVQYYFDPTLPDIPMLDVASYTGMILSGSQAAMFWAGAVVIGIVAPAALVFVSKKVEGNKLATYAGAGLACAVVGGIVWRCLLYMVAISVFAMY